MSDIDRWLEFFTYLLPLIVLAFQLIERHARKRIEKWSHRQDDAIFRAQQEIDELKIKIRNVIRSNVILRTYAKRLVNILQSHNINHPSPPDALYMDEDISEKRE